MKTISLLITLTFGMLFWSCVDLSAVTVKECTIRNVPLAMQPWSTIPAPADGLQVVLDPVMIPEEPQFLVLQLP